MATKAISSRASRGVRRGGPRRASPAAIELIREHRKLSAIAGRYWDKAEVALDKLVPMLGERIVGVENGVFAKIQDLFAAGNTAMVIKAMRRYKLVICDATGKEIRFRDRKARATKATAKPKTDGARTKPRKRFS
jgi:hypothetical protein